MHKINADLQACFIVQYTFIEYSTLVNFSSEPDLCTRSESTFNLPSWLQLCTKCRFSNTVSQQWLLRRGEFSRFSLSLLRFSQICPASRNNTREKRILLDNLWDIKKGLMISVAWSGTERASAYLSSDSMGFYSALSGRALSSTQRCPDEYEVQLSAFQEIPEFDSAAVRKRSKFDSALSGRVLSSAERCQGENLVWLSACRQSYLD